MTSDPTRADCAFLCANSPNSCPVHGARPVDTPDSADVELVARIAYEADAEIVGPQAWTWSGVPVEIRDQYEVKARRQLAALAEAVRHRTDGRPTSPDRTGSPTTNATCSWR